jgi:hypothetical protein
MFYNPINLYPLVNSDDLKITYRNILKYAKSGNFIYIFESNFIYWILISIVCSLNGNTAHINLIRSDLIIESIKNDPIEFKRWFRFCKLISGKLITVSVLNEKLSREILNLTGIEVDVIPTFSGLDFSEELLSNHNSKVSNEGKVLIAAPYPSDLTRLNKFLNEYPNLNSKIKVSTWVNEGKSYLNHEVEIVNSHLSDEDYALSLLSCKHLVLLYTNTFHIYGSSSKIYDAAQLGVPICVPKDTSAAEQVRDVVKSFVFNADNDEELLSAITDPNFYEPKVKRDIPNAGSAVDFLLFKDKDRHEIYFRAKILKLVNLRIEKILLNDDDFLINKIESTFLFRILRLFLGS